MIILYYNQERTRVKNKEENKMENTYKLTGSEKQITWATDIINDIMNTLDKNIEINKERNQERDVKAFEMVKNKINKIINQKIKVVLDTDNK